MHKKIVWAFAAVLSLSGLPARASIIMFNNFGPGHTYDTLNTAGFTTGSGTFLGTQVFGQQFTPLVSGTATQIDVAINYDMGFTNNVTLSLQNDSGGLPGSTITSWSLTSMPVSPGCCDTVTLSQSLTAGTQYWLVMSPGDPNTFANWNANSTGDMGRLWFGGTTVHASGVRGAFDVLGAGSASSVPEPGTITAGVVVLLIIAVRRASAHRTPRRSF